MHTHCACMHPGLIGRSRIASIPCKPGRYPGIASDATMTRYTQPPMLAAAESGEPLSLLRLREVARRTGQSRSTIYRGVKLGTFPAPVKLGERSSAWCSREVDRWIAGCIAARDSKGVA